jgi:hypothetical protein
VWAKVLLFEVLIPFRTYGKIKNLKYVSVASFDAKSYERRRDIAGIFYLLRE